MTSATTDRPTTESVAEGAWDGFAPGPWQDAIDVRDFIQRNYTPYDGDASFLAGPTAKTLAVWDHLERNYLSEERRRRVYDGEGLGDRKSTRLNSSHVAISYAVFCLTKKR